MELEGDGVAVVMVAAAPGVGAAVGRADEGGPPEAGTGAREGLALALGGAAADPGVGEDEAGRRGATQYVTAEEAFVEPWYP
jgi:hypothetical protein